MKTRDDDDDDEPRLVRSVQSALPYDGVGDGDGGGCVIAWVLALLCIGLSLEDRLLALVLVPLAVAACLVHARMRSEQDRVPKGVPRSSAPRNRLRALAVHLTRGRFDVEPSGQVVVRGHVRGRDVSLVAPSASLELQGEVVRMIAPVAATFAARVEVNPTTGELVARITDGGGSSAEAERLLRDDPIARELGKLFAKHDVERVEVRDGELVATARLWRFAPAHLERGLVRLALIARALERPAGPGSLRPVLTARPGAAAARCPFCRDPLGAAGAVVACARCQTRVHEACWRELERCTATGCTCAVAEPVVVEDPGISLGPLPCPSCGARDLGCSRGACQGPPRRRLVVPPQVR